MNGCPCPHETHEHAPLGGVLGQQFCLVAGCDCNGTHDEVINAAVQRSMAKRRVLHDLTDVVRNAACGLPDAMAYDVAVAVLEKFNLEEK